jgi:hypothetical protein
LVEVGSQHPGELIILVTGEPDLRSRVAERQSLRAPWLNKTYVEIVEIEGLGPDELVAAFVDMLGQRGIRAESDVEAAACQVLNKKMTAKDFSNMHAVRSLADKAINIARTRSPSRDITLSAADVRAASENL